MNVLPIPFLILILGESSEHHGIPGYVVALIGLDLEVQSNIMEAREEVESVPGTLSGRLLAWGDLVHSGVRQGGLRECWVGEDGEGVDGRTVIETSSVGKYPGPSSGR